MSEKMDSNEELLKSIKERMPVLKELWDDMEKARAYEEGIYRYYHGSFKVYRMQEWTKKIVDELIKVKEPVRMLEMFQSIYCKGVNKEFVLDHNSRWEYETSPIVTAFLHARYFLEMIVKYGDELSKAPNMLPTGWASVLYFYGCR